MTTPANPVANQVSLLNKMEAWIKKEFTAAEAGLEKVVGSDFATKLEAAGKALVESDLYPLLIAALADATDVVTGQMSVSKAVSSLVSMAESAGKTMTQAAALQIIAVGQNALPAKPATVTPVA